MITSIVTFLTTRIVYVFIVTVVVVAAVPTLIVAIHGNTITISSGPVASSTRERDDQERVRVRVEIKKAGDDVVVRLNNQESACDSQIAQLASVSKLSAAATKAAITRGEGEFHAATVPFVSEIKADEDDADRIQLMQAGTELTFLVRITTIETTALGDDSHLGTLVTVCQAVLVEIREIVIVVQPKPTGGDDQGDDFRLKV